MSAKEQISIFLQLAASKAKLDGQIDLTNESLINLAKVLLEAASAGKSTEKILE
jgi:hypothetical protein